jgi:hypothetical protein
MPKTPKLKVTDIIKSAVAGKPIEVQAAFNDAIQTRMAAAIASRKEQIAQSMYGDPEDGDKELEVSEVDADEEDLEPETEETENEDI